MTPKELVLTQLAHKETPYIPYTLGYEEVVGERVDKYYGSNAWRQKIINHIVGVAPFDSEQCQAIDSVYVRDIFGSVWRTDLKPRHLEKPGLTKPSFENYNFPDVKKFFNQEKKAQAIKLCQEHQDKFLVGYFGFGLFERTWTICGFENALLYSVAEEDFFEELVRRIFQLQMSFIEECLKLPVDGIMFSDDWGDQRGVILGPDRWRRFLKPHLAEFYKRVHQAGKFTLSHCCGSVVDIMPDIIEIGLDVLQSVQPEAKGMNPYELKKKYGSKITFWGGLGSQSLIPFGTPQQIRAEVKKLCQEMGRNGGYILGPAKNLQSETPTENAVAVIESFTNQSLNRDSVI